LAIGLSLATGCSSSGPDVTATNADNGGHAQVDQGKILDIVLPDDYATSKAQWRDDQTHDDSVLKYLGSRYEPDRMLAGQTSAGTFTSRYRGTKPGTTHVTLIQEDNADPPHVARRFTVDVTVT
jgi:predicted secreted protein